MWCLWSLTWKPYKWPWPCLIIGIVASELDSILYDLNRKHHRHIMANVPNKFGIILLQYLQRDANTFWQLIFYRVFAFLVSIPIIFRNFLNIFETKNADSSRAPGLQGSVIECPPWCSIVGATVTASVLLYFTLYVRIYIFMRMLNFTSYIFKIWHLLGFSQHTRTHFKFNGFLSQFYFSTFHDCSHFSKWNRACCDLVVGHFLSER